MDSKENENKKENYLDMITNIFSYFTSGDVKNKDPENLPSNIRNNKKEVNENKRDSVKQVAYNLKLKRASVLQIPQRFIMDTTLHNKKDVNEIIKINENSMIDTSMKDYEEINSKKFKGKNTAFNILDEEEPKNNFFYSPSFHYNTEELFHLNKKEYDIEKKKKIKKEKDKEGRRKKEEKYKKKVEPKEIEEKDKIKNHKKELMDKEEKEKIDIEESYISKKKEKKKSNGKNKLKEDEVKDKKKSEIKVEEEKGIKDEKEINKEKEKKEEKRMEKERKEEKKKVKGNYKKNNESGLIKGSKNQESKNRSSSIEILGNKNTNYSSSLCDNKVNFLKNKTFFENIKDNEELIRKEYSHEISILNEKNIHDNTKKYISIRNNKKRDNAIILPKLNLKQKWRSFSVEELKTIKEHTVINNKIYNNVNEIIQDNDDKTTVSGNSN